MYHAVRYVWVTPMPVWVKICGITSLEDAELAVAAGADAVGLNLVPASKRCVTVATARAIATSVMGRSEVVLVVADRPVAELLELRASTGADWLQLHGAEPPAALDALLPMAYKVVHVASRDDVALAARYAGARLLCDTKVPGTLGGSGQRFDWSLVADLARTRELVLAGGLGPDNVAEAVQELAPFGVDTASGVESADPRRKDSEKVRAFVQEARRAARDLARGRSLDTA
jgi:phosphoribosylanthranilate isomerase